MGLPLARRTAISDSRLSQELGKWAEIKGKSDEYRDAIYEAYFAHGLNIADPSVLLDAVEISQLSREEAQSVIETRLFSKAVDDDWEKSEELKIMVAPTYILNQDKLIWIPNHEQLLTKFQALLSNGGVVAVQIPQFWDMPLGQIIENNANATRWKDQTGGVSTLFTIHDYSFYYDILSNLFNSIEIWETHYLHVLENHVSVLEMIRSTGLKPYLERLTDDSDRREFEEAVLNEIREAYPIQKNGKVLLPFNRLFFTGRKSAPV